MDHFFVYAISPKIYLMSIPLLSICIPTFNREVFLKDCIKSLKSSWSSDIEIVVSDNASTDGTIAMLEDYARQLPLRWQQHPTNLGFDHNCAAVVSMARGRYCWLLGSDDCITEGALAQIMVQLRQHDPDVFHFGYIQADLALRPMSRSAPPALATPITMNAIELPKYLSALPNVSLLFAFISCFIFRRQSWIDQEDRLPGWLDSYYVHTFMLHCMLAAGATVLSTDKCFVIARGGNPNEFNSTVGKFLCLDATTLQRINREIYSDAPQNLAALGCVFRRSHKTRSLIFIVSNGGAPQILLCRSTLVALGHSKLLIQLLLGTERLGMMPVIARLIELRRSILNSRSLKKIS
jgi:abequosyltransferase